MHWTSRLGYWLSQVALPKSVFSLGRGHSIFHCVWPPLRKVNQGPLPHYKAIGSILHLTLPFDLFLLVNTHYVIFLHKGVELRRW